MLDSIEIKNFKRIGAEGLKLEKLAKVNYLVGKNGSGKSSVLEAISLTNEIKNPKFIFDRKIHNEKNKGKAPIFRIPFYYPNKDKYIAKIYNKSEFKMKFKGDEKIITFVFIVNKENNNFYSIKNKLSQYIKSKSILFSSSTMFDPNINIMPEFKKIFHYNNMSWNTILEQKWFDDGNFDSDEHFEWLKDEVMPNIFTLKSKINTYLCKDNQLSDGLQHIKNLTNDLLYYVNHSFNLFLIEEPENTIHPLIQKMLPELFEEISKIYQIQIFITTHSPFIISAAGEFPDTQNVYMIVDGKCLKPEGSSGKDVKGIAATMLGAGIEDLSPSTVVFCAQSEKEFLERINIKWYFKDIHFVVPTINKVINGGDECLEKLKSFIEAGHYSDTFYKGAEVIFYLDEKNTEQMKIDDRQHFEKIEKTATNKVKAKLIYSTKTKFELKFTDDEIEAKEWHKSAKDFASKKAEELINKGESGKTEFEEKFKELGGLFGFSK